MAVFVAVVPRFPSNGGPGGAGPLVVASSGADGAGQGWSQGDLRARGDGAATRDTVGSATAGFVRAEGPGRADGAMGDAGPHPVASVLGARRSGRSLDGAMPHLRSAASMLAAAADRAGQARAWHDAGVAVAWGHDARYERPPLSVESPTGRVWLEGRLTAPTDDEAVREILRRVAAGEVAACGRLRGSFSVWWWDAPNRTLRVVTDPFARRPVYWGRSVDDIVVGSEIRTVVAHPGVRAELDEVALVAGLADLVVPVATTPLRGVSFVAPGHVLVVRQGREPRVEPWMRWPEEVDHRPSQVEWADRLRDLTLQAVRRGLAAAGASSPAPLGRPPSVGVTVSGGLDSSMLAAMAVSLVGPAPLRALTMRFPGLPSDETRYQDLMLEATGLAEISVGLQRDVDYWEAIRAEAERRAVPVSWLQPEIDALMRAAAGAGLGAVVRGVGGDELFAPGTATALDAVVSRRFGAVGQFLGDPPLPARLRWVARSLRAAGEQALPRELQARAAVWNMPDWLSPSRELAGHVVDLVAAAPRGFGLSAAMRRDRWGRFATAGARAQADWTDATETASGLAMIDPLLDVDVVAEAMRVPESLRWAPGDPRRLQRGVAHSFLPEAVMRRHDKAYMGPVTFSHLRGGSVAEVLGRLELAERGLVDAAAVAELYRATAAAHDRGDRELAGGPIDLCLVLSAEALTRSVN